MAGYPAGGGGGGGGHHDYDDGYGHPAPAGQTDSYYQDDQQYYDSNGYDGHGAQEHDNADGYYDESWALPVTVPRP